ncbi:methionine ABC transporter ATP-binding protein [Thalassiella azotivora]
MIRLDSVRKVFRPPGRPDRQVIALDDVTVHVPAGEVLGVVGPSGSGKSTLARCVNLLERPTSGTVTVDGAELTALAEPELRLARRRIGMIFQHFNLLDSRTAAGNVEHPLQLAGVPRARRRARAEELLDLVGLADKRDVHPAQLSGGQKQRVAIARALAAEPAVLLCDEATSALDPVSTASVLSLLRRLRADLDLTVLLITHEMDVVKAVCDSAVLLEHGRVVDAGHLADVSTRPDSALADHLVPPLPPVAVATGRHLVEVTLTGDVGSDAVLALLVREHGLDVDVAGGRVETVGGQRFGRLQLAVAGDEAVVARAATDLTRRGAHVSAPALAGVTP